jgi:hypothetical protein
VAGLRTAVLISLAAATALYVAACGDGSDTPAGEGPSATVTTSTGPASAGRTAPAPTGVVLRLGPDDNGKTVTLAVGDRLQVILSGGRLTGSWALASEPRSVLAPDSRAVPLGGVAFVAREAGSGQVVLVRVLCGPVVDPPGCPGGSGVGPGETAPTRWAITVVVR